jgi:hypothetical protein
MIKIILFDTAQTIPLDQSADPDDILQAVINKIAYLSENKHDQAGYVFVNLGFTALLLCKFTHSITHLWIWYTKESLR